MTSAGWVKLGKLVKRERVRLHCTQAEFAERLGLTGRSLISQIERGARDDYEPATHTAIELALGWKQGSVDRVAAGGQPELEVDPVMAELRLYWPRLTHDARIALLELVKVIAH